MNRMELVTAILKKNSELTGREIERIFAEKDGDTAVLWEACLYSAMSGGKRIRPTLTFEFAAMLGGSEDSALPLAVATELVHTYSLIHDDLPCMDNDNVRRGKPSCHIVYGEATALLAGDALLTEAFRTVSESGALSDKVKLKAITELSEKAGIRGMIGGQQIDLIGESTKLSAGLHRKMNLLKTAALMECAAVMGVTAANGDKEAERAAREYGRNIGLAFQAVDDLLDKGEENKTTYLSFMTENECRKYVDELTDKALESVRHYGKSRNLCLIAEWLRSRTA